MESEPFPRIAGNEEQNFRQLVEIFSRFLLWRKRRKRIGRKNQLKKIFLQYKLYYSITRSSYAKACNKWPDSSPQLNETHYSEKHSEMLTDLDQCLHSSLIRPDFKNFTGLGCGVAMLNQDIDLNSDLVLFSKICADIRQTCQMWRLLLRHYEAKQSKERRSL